MQARILIVDDDQDILSALKKRLAWMGHETFTAEDGEQALRLATEESLDLMLLDIELPGLSGLDILKQFAEKRSSVPTQSVPEVIVITAFGTIDRAVEAIRLGACDFLTKPFEPAHLSIVMAHLCYGLFNHAPDRSPASGSGGYEHVVGQEYCAIPRIGMPASCRILTMILRKYLDRRQQTVPEFRHLAAQGIHESSVSFLGPRIKRFGVREHKVPCLGCIQHQQLLRCVVPREQDDKDGGVTGEADVGEDMHHGAGGKHDFP